MRHFPAKQRRHTKGDTGEEIKCTVISDDKKHCQWPRATAAEDGFIPLAKKFQRKFGPRTEVGNVQVV